MSAKKRTSSTQHEKPEEGCNQDELSREKMKEHPTPVDELPPGEGKSHDSKQPHEPVRAL